MHLDPVLSLITTGVAEHEPSPQAQLVPTLAADDQYVRSGESDRAQQR